MGEIKVGEYIRTDKGNIGKVINIKEDRTVIMEDNETIVIIGYYYYLDTNKSIFKNHLRQSENIVKHDFNVIKLIKEGDFVNGEEVEYIYLKGIRPYIKLANRYKNKVFENRIYMQDIKTIIAKEQFKSMEYRLEE